jgi:hypothetical protein
MGAIRHGSLQSLGALGHRRWFHVLVLGGLLAHAGVGPAAATLIDVVVGQVDSAVVSASDIALARALGLFGFTPSNAPIDAADVDRYARALSDVLEASRLGLGPTPAEIDQAWAALKERHGGPALRAWLESAAIDIVWARRALEAHLRWRAWAEFHEGFADVPASAGASSDTRPFGSDAVVRRLLESSETVPLPFAMPQ